MNRLFLREEETRRHLDAGCLFDKCGVVFFNFILTLLLFFKKKKSKPEGPKIEMLTDQDKAGGRGKVGADRKAAGN